MSEGNKSRGVGGGGRKKRHRYESPSYAKPPVPTTGFFFLELESLRTEALLFKKCLQWCVFQPTPAYSGLVAVYSGRTGPPPHIPSPTIPSSSRPFKIRPSNHPFFFLFALLVLQRCDSCRMFQCQFPSADCLVVETFAVQKSPVSL